MTKEEYKYCLERDAIANYRTTVRAKIIGDDRWKFICAMRKLEYLKSKTGPKSIATIIGILFAKICFNRYSVRCNYSIPIGVAGSGLGLPHRGTIVINTTTKIGTNCRIHEGVTIGSTSGSVMAATIGNNVFIGTGAKIIGEITIANDVAIGANAVVVKSITESGTTWAGNPARKISEKSSLSNLPPDLFQ